MNARLLILSWAFGSALVLPYMAASEVIEDRCRVPGFHRGAPELELVPPIEVEFENGREIPAEIPPDQGVTVGPLGRIVFYDVFGPYERHLYKIP